MSEASQAAKKAAETLGVDLSTVEGTGNEGLVTKADVENAAETQAQTNIMQKAKLERTKAAPEGLEAVQDRAVSAGGIELPTQEDLIAIIKDLQGQVEGLKEAQAGLIERENQTRDLTDEFYFIAKPNGHRWEERRVVDGKTVEVEFVATAFYGPFEDESKIEEYLTAKKAKRVDSFIDWGNVQTMTGRDARMLDEKETKERETHFASAAPVNVLDRRIFAANHTGHVPGQGQLVESTDKAGPAPYNRANAAR